MNNDTQTIFSEFSDPYRRSLIDRICVALGNDNIPRVKALGLWFADIKALEVLVGHEQNPDMLQSFLVDFSQYNLDLALQHKPVPPLVCGHSPESRYLRADRDQMLDMQGSHPYYTEQNRIDGTTRDEHGENSVWRFLRTFWSNGKVDAWEQALMPGGVLVSTERLCNLITLDVTAHDQWNRGLIAFQPISVNEEETEMRIAFHWLPFRSATIARNDRMPPAAVRDMDLGTPPHKSPGRFNYFVDMET
ncbi:unnamed protein product [Penicillium palitans]